MRPICDDERRAHSCGPIAGAKNLHRRPHSHDPSSDAMSEVPSGIIAQQSPRPMDEDADAAAPSKRAADTVAGDDEPFYKKPKQEGGAEPARPNTEGGDDAAGTDDDDEPKDDIKRFAARLRPGTLKHTCFVLLQRAGRDGMETNAMLETAEKENMYVGKNRNVLTTTLSHESWFVHNPDVKSHWCIRSFLEGPEASRACVAAKPGSDPAGPGRSKGPAKPRKVLTPEEKMAAAAEKAKKATVKAAESAVSTASKVQAKVEAKIHAQITKGNDDRIKKAAKQLATEAGNVAKHRAAVEAAEAKAVAAGVAKEDLEKCAEETGKKGAKAKPAKAIAAAKANAGAGPGGPGKSASEILKEPGAPTTTLPERLTVFTGDQSDRHVLMAWKKEVDKFKEKIERERDAYVQKRRKQLRAENAKEGAVTGKLIADFIKCFENLEKAKLNHFKAEEILRHLKEKSELLKETLDMKAELMKEKLDEKNAKAMAELEAKLAKLEGKKMDEAKAAIEKERVKELAKAEREAQRKAEKAERDRVKEEEKAARAAAREAEFAARRKKKEDAKKARQREYQYPIDDEKLRVQLLEEAKEKGIKPEELSPHPYRELPKPTPIADGALVADEAALADFFAVFGEFLGVSPNLHTAEGLREVIVGCGKELVDLYGCLLRPSLEVSVVGKSRNALRWKRVLADATWPEVVRQVLKRKKCGGTGVEALGRRPWNDLSPGEHTHALLALSDLCLSSVEYKVKPTIDSRMTAAHKLKSQRINDYIADCQRRKAIEYKAKEKRKAIRAKKAAERRAEREAKRAAREAALAAGQKVEDLDPEDDDDDDDEDSDDEADGNMDMDADMDDAPDIDVKEEEEEPEAPAEEEKPTAKAKKADVKKEPKKEVKQEPEVEPTFELPAHLIAYDGHPDDRKALMAWRAEHNRVSQQLEAACREYEKKKRSEARKVLEREKMERMRREEEEEQKRQELERIEKAKEMEARKKEEKRMQEDSDVAVRVKSLGQDRDRNTYWWGIGGVKAALYVEDIDGKWFVYTTRQEVKELMDALHHWGIRERKLKQELKRRVVTINAEFRRAARELEDAEADAARRAASGYPKRAPRASAAAVADEQDGLSAARRFMAALCQHAEVAVGARRAPKKSEDQSAADAQSDADAQHWRAFKGRANAADAHQDVAHLLLELEDALYSMQKIEFMSAEEMEARNAAKEAGEDYESDESDADDDFDDDDETLWEEENQPFHESYEDKIKTGMIYPIWDTHFERRTWREAVSERSPAAALAFQAACLEDCAAIFLKAVARHPR